MVEHHQEQDHHADDAVDPIKVERLVRTLVLASTHLGRLFALFVFVLHVVVRRSGYVLVCVADGVAPKLFQSVMFPLALMEDVYHDIHVIEQDPSFRFLSFTMPWFFASLLQGTLLDTSGYGIDLSITITMANDEMIAYRIGHISQIQINDVLAFHFLDPAHNGIQKPIFRSCDLEFFHPVYLATIKSTLNARVV